MDTLRRQINHQQQLAAIWKVLNSRFDPALAAVAFIHTAQPQELFTQLIAAVPLTGRKDFFANIAAQCLMHNLPVTLSQEQFIEMHTEVSSPVTKQFETDRKTVMTREVAPTNDQSELFGQENSSYDPTPTSESTAPTELCTDEFYRDLGCSD